MACAPIMFELHTGFAICPGVGGILNNWGPFYITSSLMFILEIWEDNVV